MKKTRKMKKVLFPLLSVLILTVGLLLTAVPGMAQSTTIGDFVWYDTNKDGIQDVSEPGIEGVTVELWGYYHPYDKIQYGNTTTNATGYYNFTNVYPCNYLVKFVAPECYVFTLKDAGTDDTLDSDADPLTGKTDLVTIAACEENLTVDAGLYSSCACELEITKTCFVPPPSVDLECEDKIAAMLLRYTGPNITGANVEFKGAKGATAMYTNINLTSGVTVLSDSSQNDFTIDAAASGKRELGAKTKIYINGVEEVIHTSCSTPFVAGAPAPLDKPKGDPSPNWFVVSFRDKSGNMVEPPPDPVPSDKCMIQLPGGWVEYTYTVTNTGGVNITNIIVDDDVIGVVPGSPIAFLAPGDSVTLTATQFLDKNTTNTVTATGYSGTAQCEATDSAEVIVLPPPPPLFECDGKIIELTMIWDGTQAIHVKAWKGKVGSTLLAYIDNVNKGDEVTISGYAGAPNDVIWELFEAGTGGSKIGESKFHLSCSDNDMNGPEDCGKYQGDGKSKKNSKKNKSAYINEWLLEGMVDSAGGILDCTT